MIAFGCAVSEPAPYTAYAEPGIRRAAESDSEVYAFASVGTIGRSLNLLLDAAARHEDLEALVLVHPHLELADPRLCHTVRDALRDPRVAVVGCAGATGVRSIAWWQGSVVTGRVVHRYTEHGGGELPAYAWNPVGTAPAEVDSLDGALLALSPWAVRELRFDEGLVHNYGFDLDFCLQARAAGHKAVVADLAVIRHRPLDLVENLELWVEAHIQMARKWEGRMPGGAPATTEWKARARRAEAEREAVRAEAYSRRLAIDARLEELDRELAETTTTLSWRVTRPLRELNRWRRARRP
jgi:hypothetical protein